ncbi:FxsA family protein [Oceanomicrobium pacificus]|uniref:FxsA family protein n=1 Tax=Oceanomicrobium pacificus TaxID=2692916 RepID=A0A6B0TU10_9RHOB|nr:FxsA family protein [Oceanomicrobium pacificus]MXU64722.1 FxsA family protein [Oceanomicrobium pacificus]
MWLFFAFVAVPILEIALFIQVGGLLGLWPTLAIVILTAVAGTALMRRQGLSTLAELQDSMERGGDPTGPIANGALILVAGVLLLTPGFFTDSIGIALLIPPFRKALISWGASRVAAQSYVYMSHQTGTGRAAPQPPRGDSSTIDGDFEILDDVPPDARRGTSGWTRDPH